MNIRLMAAALAVAIVTYSQTTTHDDPIIIRGGSVILNFGLATKAFANSGLWAELDNGKWVYYQHTHMGPGTLGRTMQALGQAKQKNPLVMQFEAEKLFEYSLDLPTQRQTRIEIFLKGIPVGGTQAVALPNGPHIVLEAVDMAQPGSNPLGYQGVPCCAHPGFVPKKKPMLPKPVDVNQVSQLCKELHAHSATDLRPLTWAWRVTSKQKLVESAGGPSKKPGSGRFLVEAQYKDPAYQSVALDSYSVGLASPGIPGGLRYLNDTKGKQQLRVPFGMCPSLELCATEQVAGKYCELSTRDCKGASTGFDPK